MENGKKDKRQISILLPRETYQSLVKMARRESRPTAQMARVIIEKAAGINPPTDAV